jgi:exonuclease SbcD
MKILIVGDPHLGGSLVLGKNALGTSLNSKVIDRFNLLDYCLEYAVDNDIDTIVVTGDIFDEPKPFPSLISQFLSWLKRCEINDIDVHIIIGNHDILRSGSFVTTSLDVIEECDLDHVSIHKDISTIFIDGVGITFLPFRDRKSFNVEKNEDALAILQGMVDYELALIPRHYHKLLVGHLAIEGSIFIGEIDDLTNELLCPKKMFLGYNRVIMGHIHSPQVMSQSPFIAHIGSLDRSDFGEEDQDKIIMIYDSSYNELKNHILPTRALNKIKIDIPKGMGDTDKFVKDKLLLKKDILVQSSVKVDIHLEDVSLLSINRSEIEHYLYSLGVFNVVSIHETKVLNIIKKEVIINTTIDMPSAIKTYANNYVDESERENFIELAQEICKQFREEK